MKWIESTGGPLILMASNLAHRWQGLEVDYDRACKVDGWLGVLPAGNREALVLGDESLPTTVWIGPDCCWLVGWSSGSNEPSVARWLERVCHVEFPGSPVVVDFGHRSCILFDSSASATETGDKDVLRIVLPASQCEIRTQLWQPDECTCLRLDSIRAVTMHP